MLTFGQTCPSAASLSPRRLSRSSTASCTLAHKSMRLRMRYTYATSRANKSAEYPEGILNKATLKAFMAIEGSEDNVSLNVW